MRRRSSAGAEADRVQSQRADTRGSPRRDHHPSGAAQRHRDSASVLQAGHAARRQLPRLHGRDQGRARAGTVVLSRADRGHGRAQRQSARGPRAEAHRRDACRRRARARLQARLGTGKMEAVAWHRRLRASRPARSRRRICRIRRWRSISTPASNARVACVPAARNRSTTSSATPFAVVIRRSYSTSATRWASPPASPAANACRRVRPGRWRRRTTPIWSRPTRRSRRSAPIAAWVASSPITSRTTTSFASRGATGRPTTSACASKAASASTTCIIGSASPSR